MKTSHFNVITYVLTCTLSFCVANPKQQFTLLSHARPDLSSLPAEHRGLALRQESEQAPPVNPDKDKYSANDFNQLPIYFPYLSHYFPSNNPYLMGGSHVTPALQLPGTQHHMGNQFLTYPNDMHYHYIHPSLQYPKQHQFVANPQYFNPNNNNPIYSLLSQLTRVPYAILFPIYWPQPILPPQQPSDTRDTSHNDCDYFSYKGRCLSSNDCSRSQGRPTNYCSFSGLGVMFCCVFQLTCSSTMSQEISYFRNPNYPLKQKIVPETNCKLIVEKYSSDFCGIRVTGVNLKLPANTGYCEKIYFGVTGVRNSKYAHLCGDLKGHIYEVDMRSTNEVELFFHTDRSVSFMWNIKVEQILCSEFSSMSANAWPEEGEIPLNPPPMDSPPPDTQPQSHNPPATNTQGSSSSGNSGSSSSSSSCGVSSHLKKTNLQRLAFSGSTFRDFEPSGESSAENDERNVSIIWDGPELKDSLFYKLSRPDLSQFDQKITRGKLAKKGQFPWLVAMYVRSTNRFHCGASVIAKQHVLTAAHCVSSYRSRPSRLKLHIGDYDVSNTADGLHVVATPVKIKVHRGYSTATLQNDIAIIMIDKILTFSDTIQPICLPTYNIGVDKKLLTVSGWGRDENRILQQIVKYIRANVIGTNECDNRWSAIGGRGLIVNSMICIDPQEGDSCKGDSGGPATMPDPNNPKQEIQVGIVSFGSSSCTDQRLPGVYTRIGYHLNWIRQQLP